MTTTFAAQDAAKVGRDLINNSSRLYPGPEFESVMERVEAAVPIIMANAAESERIGKLTEEIVQALHESGVFRISVPQAVGGYELTPRQVIQVLERVSYADPSVGWTLMALQMVAGTTAAYLGPDCVDDLFPDGGYRLIAGQGTRLGTAKKVDEGYLVSGQWSFASGLYHASHIHTAAFDAENEKALVFTFPKEKAEITDNWKVMGLRATGSIDYSCQDVFVPDTYVYETSAMTPKLGGAVYKMGLANMSGVCHTGWALGIARRMLDELKALAAKKTGTPGANVDTQQFYAEYAQAEADLRSARSWVLDVWADNEATLDDGDYLSTDQETMTRLMLNNTTWSAHRVGLTVHKWAATSVARDGDLQRLFRDLNVGTQHVTSGPVVLQKCGKKLAGLAPEGEWVFIDLVEPDQES